jgi:hypothetical protein
MRSMQGKEDLISVLKGHKLERLLKKKDFDYLKLENKRLKAKTPAEPSLILWENLGVGK